MRAFVRNGSEYYIANINLFIMEWNNYTITFELLEMRK